MVLSNTYRKSKMVTIISRHCQAMFICISIIYTSHAGILISKIILTGMILLMHLFLSW